MHRFSLAVVGWHQADGGLGGCIIALTDVEELTQQSFENRIKTAVLDRCQLIIGISMVGDNPEPIYNNAYTLGKLGWTSGKGRTLLDAVYPADRDKVTTLIPDILEKKKGSHEIRLYNELTGIPFCVQWDVMVIEEHGLPPILATISPDITERKLRQQHLEAQADTLANAIDMAQLGTWQVDVEQGMVHFSPRHQQMFGSPASSLELREAIMYVASPDRQGLIETFFSALQNNTEGKFQAEYSITHAATGQKRIIQSIGQSYFDADGRLVSFSGIAQDVTAQRDQQRNLEVQVKDRTQKLDESNRKLSVGNQQMKEVNAQLARSNEDLHRFAYVASHDLQEPLRKIMQFSSRLEAENQSASPKAKDYLVRMSTAAERMSTLIDDLLAFSRVSNGAIKKQAVPLKRIIDDAITNLEVAISEKGATIYVDAFPEVHANTSQLTQLFQNLISNAVKFHQTAGDGSIIAPVIRISYRAVELAQLPADIKPSWDANRFHQISVADNGIGFDEVYLDRIFQVFQRLHGRSEYSGTGIGLAICERIASNHGGAISASSKIGEGATFEVFLPIKDG